MSFNNSANNLFREQKVVNSAVNYIVLADDVIINITDTSAPRTVTLPAPGNSNIGKFFTVKDTSGNAGANSITVDSVSGNIDGVATHVIALNYASATFYSDGTNYSIDNKTGFATSTTVSPLTSGGVMFANGSQLTQDNANLFWDDTNNRLGINTNTPAGPFEVDQFIYTNTSSLLLTNTFQAFTPLNGVGYYFVNARHPNGDFFNFSCIVGLDLAVTFYLAVTGSSDSGGTQVNRQGNLTTINVINDATSNATIQSTGEVIEIQMSNATDNFNMRRVGASPSGLVNFQVIRFGTNF